MNMAKSTTITVSDCINGSGKSTVQRFIYIDFIISFWMKMNIFPDPVEDNYGIIDGITDNGKDGCNKAPGRPPC